MWGAMTGSEYQQLVDFLGRRFETIDRRFDAIDGQFVVFGRRFGALEQRFDAFEQRVQDRLCFLCSYALYGDAVEEPMTEDHPFNNRNFYGATNICGEACATVAGRGCAR